MSADFFLLTLTYFARDRRQWQSPRLLSITDIFAVSVKPRDLRGREQFHHFFTYISSSKIYLDLPLTSLPHPAPSLFVFSSSLPWRSASPLSSFLPRTNETLDHRSILLVFLNGENYIICPRVCDHFPSNLHDVFEIEIFTSNSNRCFQTDQIGPSTYRFFTFGPKGQLRK